MRRDGSGVEGLNLGSSQSRHYWRHYWRRYPECRYAIHSYSHTIHCSRRFVFYAYRSIEGTPHKSDSSILQRYRHSQWRIRSKQERLLRRRYQWRLSRQCHQRNVLQHLKMLFSRNTLRHLLQHLLWQHSLTAQLHNNTLKRLLFTLYNLIRFCRCSLQSRLFYRKSIRLLAHP